MKRLFYRELLWGTALTLALVQPLGAQAADPAAPKNKAGTNVQVQPSADVRYPQAKDILNPQAPVKPVSPAAAPLWSSTPVPVSDLKSAKNAVPIPPGWYIQSPVSGTPDELQSQAQTLGEKLSPAVARGLWLETDGKSWTVLVGPWTPQETADFLQNLNAGKAPGPSLTLVRR